MSSIFDDYEDLELDEEVAKAMDVPLDRHLSPGAVAFGSPAYISDYRQRLVISALENTKGKITPHSWQLDVAIAAHLGRDVLLIAGTGAGKTLPMIANCWLNSKLLVFLVSPLNVLGNQQAQKFRDWNIKAIAVNSTTSYPGLYRDVLAGKYQVVILSIEAFTNTTRLLPTVKSPELASRGSQLLVVDEAHCMAKWGKTFRPKYAVLGDLKLISVGRLPCIAATATANAVTRESIKQSLRFESSSLEKNLGNHRERLAYSVHRLKHASASLLEILLYFPCRRFFTCVVLVFVNSRPLGQAVLHAIRQHIDPAIRWQVQIFHAFRGDFAKAVLAALFEKDGGFMVLVCTEIVALGVDFGLVSMVLQMLSTYDIETVLQRLGRGGRREGILCEGIVLAQDSVFDDSKEGQKRAQKAQEVEIAAQANTGSRKSTSKRKSKASAKANSTPAPRLYLPSILCWINTPGCRVEAIDKEFDNPPRKPGGICYCDFHRKQRGEKSIQEIMEDEAKEHQRQEEQTNLDNTPILPKVGQVESGENSSSGSDTEASELLRSKYRKPAERKLYAAAIEDWIDKKYDSPECAHLNVSKDWILSPAEVKNISKRYGLTSIRALAALRPTWVHLETWGNELLEVLAVVTQRVEAEEQSRRLAVEAKRQEALERERQAQESRAQQDAERSRKIEEAVQASMAPAKPRRRPLPANATEEQKAARKAEMAEERRRKSSQAYWLKQAVKQEVKDEPGIEDTPGAGPSRPSTSLLPFSVHETIPNAHQTHPNSIDPMDTQPKVSVAVKQELIDDYNRLLDDQDIIVTNELSTTSHAPPNHPPTPSTPACSTSFYFNIQTPDDAREQYSQPTPVSRPRKRAKTNGSSLLVSEAAPIPSSSRPRARPKPRKPKAEEDNLPQ
ncbi:DEAD/DEAH box helicase [Ceratobasidium sp. AG-Ba]|nr:DEAD/DEAH box helicase [Ceratobasidium sp. AG-Ba]